ncbi:MAG: tetratricopeptide repeat protein, partial [Chloroflexi bacterium]
SADSEEQQLLNYLRGKHLLLVLDNFEHLLDGIGLVDRILATAPDVRIIATSREALNLDWEWRYDVPGLVTPSADCDFEKADAVRLFAERARRAQPAFRVADERACVVDLCQRVEGMPLGIELAAAWLRVLPCSEIAGELLDLENPSRQAAERHLSLRAVFDQTWARLTEREQHAFMALSVFRGGFTRQAGEGVTGAALPTFAGLVHKALLRRHPHTGRYEVHELLRQYAEARLGASGEAQRVRDAHSQYYLEALAAREAGLKSAQEVQTLASIGSDIENARAAWFWAITRERFDAVGRAMWALLIFFTLRHRTADGEEAIGALVRALEIDQPAGLRGVLLGRALAYLGDFKMHLQERSTLYDSSLAILRRLGGKAEIAYPLSGLAGCAIQRGDFKQAQSLWEEALTVAQAHGDLWLIASIKGWLGFLLSVQMGALEDAEPLLREALAMATTLGSPGFIAISSLQLAALAGMRGNYSEAQRLNLEALAMFREIGHQRMAAQTLGNMGWYSYVAGEYEQSLRYLQQALVILDEIGCPELF